MPKAFMSSDGLEKLVENIKNSGGGGTPYTNHNGGIRGKNLGSTFTATQKAAIADGSFNDLYVGDYWEINGIKYVIIDMDYYLGFGQNNPTLEHHLIVFPDKVLSEQGYSFTGTYYSSSEMYTTYMPQIATQLETIFGNYLINQSMLLYSSNGNVTWLKCKCIPPSMVQLQGYSHHIDPDNMPFKSNMFAIFRYSNSLLISDQLYWLQDYLPNYGAGAMAFVTDDGNIWFRSSTSYQYYLRPYFILAGTEQTQE